MENNAATPKYSSEDLTKAVEEIEKLQKSGNPTGEKPAVDEAKLNQDPTRHLFEDPIAALMEEEVIQKASAPMLAMAAFQAEFVKGVQDFCISLNEKVDELIKINLGGQAQVLKSQIGVLDMLKAVGSTQATSFKTTETDPNEQIKKSLEENRQNAENEGRPTPAFISQWLEKGVKDGKLSPMVIATFESAQKLDDVTYAAVVKDWNIARGKQE